MHIYSPGRKEKKITQKKWGGFQCGPSLIQYICAIEELHEKA